MCDDDEELGRAHREAMRRLKTEQDDKALARTIRRGVLVVNDGDGKGKSTAAFGMAIRAAGHGQRVGIVQFIKGTWKTGERVALARFAEIDHVISGEGFTWNVQDRGKDIEAARRGWDAARRMIEAARSGETPYELVILDELNIALRYGYLPLSEVLEALRRRPEQLSIVVTGRDAPAKLIAIADTVTRMQPVKHAFEAGIKARKGVDF